MTLKIGAKPGYSVWAESFAIQTVSNLLNLVVLILDEEVRGRDNPSRFISIRPESSTVTSSSTTSSSLPLQYVLLQRTRRQHFNLIAHDDDIIWDNLTVPERIRECWGLSLPGEGGDEVKEVEEVEEASDPRPTKKQKLESSASSSGWSCPSCTFVNANPGFLCCSVCGSEKS
ncbi:hypothetical protein TrLO_g11707 [Triparma laevis f. longispina]|uniref:RanBP2-type domain-containing protein n=1 Tax=Triparma laevis f. longispina TaxID=1714387 RepID=A0A9W7C8U4_9STRA|nr:hypothetical protein TrLO_g11707 [Triparma laevis f. longispina]